ncbi:MAG: hypothetical protein K0R38_4626 [Polyangiaceae bacterium]|jgi:hypothetical protein|nr:hypothetical protein [Polyangiaceae bacterium]
MVNHQADIPRGTQVHRCNPARNPSSTRTALHSHNTGLRSSRTARRNNPTVLRRSSLSTVLRRSKLSTVLRRSKLSTVLRRSSMASRNSLTALLPSSNTEPPGYNSTALPHPAHTVYLPAWAWPRPLATRSVRRNPRSPARAA